MTHSTESPPGTVAIRKSEWRDGESVVSTDLVIEEIPVALVYNGISHAVMMATPVDLEDFALGFSLSEGILASPNELLDVDIHSSNLGIELNLRVPGRAFQRIKEQRRTLAGRSGCGLCGVESLEQALSIPPPLNTAFSVSPQAISEAAKAFLDHQPLQQQTGACHGAAWCNPEGEILVAREDVGRHNALDKLLGVKERGSFDSLGFALISSRASYEMVIKCARLELPAIVALSAPTSLAVDMAHQLGITLIGFASPGRHLIYT